jgi:U2-associated protein SR140
MADEDRVEQFPDVVQKLSAPKKLSKFEQEKKDADAKRRKEEEENAAALREFEESFAHDEDEGDMISRMGERGSRGPSSGPRGGAGGLGGGARYQAPRSGPGSLPGPPMSLKRKREIEEAREAAEARRAELGYDDTEDYHQGISPAAAQEDDRDDVTPKPTMQLSSIPPGTSPEEIKALLASLVKVHSVRFTPPAGPVHGRKTLTAIATLDSSTSAAQIDKAVSTLRDRYMGCGFYLSISRHLSSVAQFQGIGAKGGSTSSEPFGAQKTRSSNPRHSMRNAPPPQNHRGFAPPESYDQQGPPTRAAGAQVEVHPPLDIATVRAIHTISGKILAQKDANRALEMEALLMTLPEVQKDERFAFLYDSKSPAGVYYRFCLWGPDSVEDQKRNAKGPERIFKDMDMDWLPPHKETPFLDLTSLAEATDHIDYDTSEDEADDEGDERKLNHGPAGETDGRWTAEKSRLSPLQRARFTRLLARMPTTIAKLRQGDITRVSNYVVNHAGGGAEEFVDLLLLNVEKPFSSTLAAAKYDSDYDSDAEQPLPTTNGRAPEQEDQDEEEDDYEPADTLPVTTPNPPPTTTTTTIEDPSNLKLIALYTISDILSASSTAGARNAWKYRTLFEAGLLQQKTFQRLGRLDKELGWGRMKSEQWRRKVGVVLSVWEGWSVFSQGVLEGLKRDFLEPPKTDAEVKGDVQAAAEDARKVEEVAPAVGGGWMSKFKKVESTSSSSLARDRDAPPSSSSGGGRTESKDTGADDDASAAKPPPSFASGHNNNNNNNNSATGSTSALNPQSAAPPHTSTPVPSQQPSRPAAAPASRGNFSLKNGVRGGSATASASVPKRRMRAEDMFGDSDEE